MPRRCSKVGCQALTSIWAEVDFRLAYSTFMFSRLASISTAVVTNCPTWNLVWINFMLSHRLYDPWMLLWWLFRLRHRQALTNLVPTSKSESIGLRTWGRCFGGLGWLWAWSTRRVVARSGMGGRGWSTTDTRRALRIFRARGLRRFWRNFLSLKTRRLVHLCGLAAKWSSPCRRV
jgi:hypothetical protein